MMDSGTSTGIVNFSTLGESKAQFAFTSPITGEDIPINNEQTKGNEHILLHYADIIKRQMKQIEDLEKRVQSLELKNTKFG